MLTFPVLMCLKKYYSRIDGICSSQLGKLACDLGIFHKNISIESAWVSSLYSDIIDKKIKDLINSYTDIILFSFSKQLEKAVNSLRKKNSYIIAPRPPLLNTNKNLHTADHLAALLVKHKIIKHNDLEIFHSLEKTGKKYQIQFPGRILIHPGSGSRRKNWPVHNFIELYDSLEKSGHNPEFIIGPADEFLSREIKKDNYPRIINKPPDLIDLNNLLKTGALYIGNDSGVSHLAAFSGLTCVIIFGSSDPVRWSPKGRAVHVIRDKTLECLPCFETREDNCCNHLCLTSISVKQVLDTAENLIFYLKEFKTYT
ncbi:glycosyltransferase family 9 protein [Desulfonema limicola]|uniref:glycosyltransferase family 9 protein n=1 Tax=Desulfonema limicola TaxID=45656 RepID=UPI001A9BA1FE|nr:glycosyltransferase family 9 protein [Desulfonema limicola]